MFIYLSKNVFYQSNLVVELDRQKVFTAKFFQSMVHVALCMYFMRIAFHPCIQTFGQGTRMF